jgi:hypothetical protein
MHQLCIVETRKTESFTSEIAKQQGTTVSYQMNEAKTFHGDCSAVVSTKNKLINNQPTCLFPSPSGRGLG